MTESCLQREYSATAGNVSVRLTLDFDGDVPLRHRVAVKFGTPGQPFHHAEDFDFDTDSGGFAQAVAKFNQIVLSVL